MRDHTRNISIAKDFSKFPAGRFREDGKSSGEEFREDILTPILSDPDIDRVMVSFDGVAGFGSSFLEEAFGGLVRSGEFSADYLTEHLKLVATEPELQDYIELSRRYIRDASATD